MPLQGVALSRLPPTANALSAAVAEPQAVLQGVRVQLILSQLGPLPNRASAAGEQAVSAAAKLILHPAASGHQTVLSSAGEHVEGGGAAHRHLQLHQPAGQEFFPQVPAGLRI